MKYSRFVSTKFVRLFLVIIHNSLFFYELKKAWLFSLFPIRILMLLAKLLLGHMMTNNQPIKNSSIVTSYRRRFKVRQAPKSNWSYNTDYTKSASFLLCYRIFETIGLKALSVFFNELFAQLKTKLKVLILMLR